MTFRTTSINSNDGFRANLRSAVTVALCIMLLHGLTIGIISGNNTFEGVPKNCSEVLCQYRGENDLTNCSALLHECACQKNASQGLVNMKCQGFESLNFTNEIDKSILLHCEENQTDFQHVVSFMRTYLQFIDKNVDKFSVRCGCPLSVHGNATSRTNDSLPEVGLTVDLSTLFCYKSMRELDLSSNCIEDLDGQFGSAGACNLVRNLDLSGNSLRALPDSWCADSNGLLFLDLSYNSLKSLSRDNFVNLVSLTRLDLTSNEVPQVLDYTFSHLANLNSLNLSHNFINSLKDYAFTGLALLEELDLSFNKVEDLSSVLFGNLSHLKLLSLHHNKIDHLPANIFYKNPNLQYLCVSFNELVTIPGNIFRYSPNLTMFLANDNQLEAIPAEIFHNNHKLYAVSFENNNLKFLHPEMLDFSSKYLVIFDASSNRFRELPHLHMAIDNGTVFGQLSIKLVNNSITHLDLPITKSLNASIRELDLSHNCIKNLQGPPGSPQIHTFRCVNCCLESIGPNILSTVILNVNLSHNKIAKLDMPLLNDFAKLLEVDLSNNGIRHINVSWEQPITVSKEEKLPLKETHVKRLIILNHNPVICDCSLIPFLRLISGVSEPPEGEIRSGMTFAVDELLCSDPPAMRGAPVLDIFQNTSLSDQIRCHVMSDICPKGCHCYYSVLHPETIINCSYRLEPDFPNLSGVGEPILLDLSNTELKNLPPKKSSVWYYFKELDLHNNTLVSLDNINVTSTLTNIYLHNNNFTEFRLSPFVAALSKNVTITLAGNPWMCNCDLMRMKEMVTNNSVIDLDEITCVADGGEQILITNLALKDCQNSASSSINKSIVVPVFAAIVVIIVIAIVLLYWKRSSVQDFFNKCCGVAVLNDVTKLYDVYVCSSRSDSEWIYLNIVAVFQTEQISYRLCFHDDQQSELSETAIAESMSQSRRIMVVLTNSFVDSSISSLHLETAYQNSVSDHVARLIIVVPDELPDITRLQPKLISFLRHNTCVYWKKPNFEQKLLFCMPKKETSNGRTTSRTDSEEIELATQE